MRAAATLVGICMAGSLVMGLGAGATAAAAPPGSSSSAGHVGQGAQPPPAVCVVPAGTVGGPRSQLLGSAAPSDTVLGLVGIAPLAAASALGLLAALVVMLLATYHQRHGSHQHQGSVTG